MRLRHDSAMRWGRLYRLWLWRWGATLDWGTHRFVLTIKEKK